MERFDATLLEETAPRGARMVALALLTELARERGRLTASHDVEALHDFRVALRRLRSWMRALGATLRGSLPRGAQRRLRRLAKASNAGRDAEVFLDWLRASGNDLPPRKRTAARWLTARFEQQEREANASLDELLDRDFARAQARLQERLEAYRVTAHVHSGMREPTFATVMSALVREHAQRLRYQLAQVRSQDDEDLAHRARLAGKRLRYLLEPVAEYIDGGPGLVERLKSLQDSLGDLHDAHIFLLILREMAAEAAMEEGRRLARAIGNGARDAAQRQPRVARPSLSGFAALGQLAQERSSEAFGRLTQEWGKRETRRFFKDVEAACRALESRARRGVEIERKYLLTRLPKSLPRSTTSLIVQGYIPGKRLVERLRSEQRGARKHFYRTVKAGTGIVRTELEEETTRGVFDTMWPLTEGKRLTKLRHRVPNGALTWEIDEFTELGLVVAELELPAEDATVEFPPWLAPFVEREVTGEAEYLNSSLAR
jgi:CHAD domain-containing protein/CYTH domain-containing protein